LTRFEPSDADRADYRYILTVLQGAPIRLLNGDVPANVSDPLHIRTLFLQALDDGDDDVVKAFLYGPLKTRRLKALTAEDRQRAQVRLGLAAHPDLQREIDAYETLIARYRSRMARMRRSFQAQGWQPPDPIVARAQGRLPEEPA
jgi:hypothetical protein